MRLIELLQNRYSVRNYLNQEVEKEKINYILECARIAPSACNNQPWHFYIVQDEKTRAEIYNAYPREWLKPAPTFIIVCKDVSQSWKRPKDGMDSGDIDASIAAEHICLAAHELDLGTCWICNFDADHIKVVLKLTEGVEPVAIFPIAYIDSEKSKKPQQKRKDIGEITTWI